MLGLGRFDNETVCTSFRDWPIAMNCRAEILDWKGVIVGGEET